MAVRSVLYVVRFPFPGETGTPLHAMGIAKAMKKKGMNVSVAQLRPWPLLRNDKDYWEGIHIYRLGRPGWSRNLYRLLIEKRPEIVHAHHILAAVLSMKPCDRAKIPLIYECHSFWRDEISENGDRPSLYYRYAGLKERKLYQKCSHIIALSEKMKETHINEMNVDGDKITVIYPGVSESWLQKKIQVSSIKIQGINPNDFVVMYCGNFAQYQGVDLLLAGMINAVKKENRIKAVLIGANEKENDAKKRDWGNLDGHVVYLGRYPYQKIPALLSQADILAIPRPNSRICWTMPRKFGEYLSAGKPIFATDVGDHKRIIEYFKCGMVADPKPDSITKALISLATMDAAIIKKMGANALNAAKRWFDWNCQMEQMKDIYNEVRKNFVTIQRR